MISDVVQERFNVAPAQVSGSWHKGQRTIGRKLVPLAIGCLTTASIMTIAAPSVAQMVPVQAGHATLATSPLSLSRTQMEQMANILLALIYLVLPLGFSVGLVLHDRHQAQRTATLEAQIKLLEKLWHQSPQA
ncbi:hypothetical protein H6F86_11125 [Phormidium sp. FACHB-592]|uniref:Uncharacterized protein n=1 Tax=Stenomitos frigidus AS-A4 TaxID=2933935 RepID=A0ABV0KNW3_9CYAN|nr:hypothetical protein [Phormidium sp. FACHB-592]MBD2074426.1 hypothetical protein [Phormidium sp. FACHB-592]